MTRAFFPAFAPAAAALIGVALFAAVASCGLAPSAWADDTLPYVTRTHPYNGFSTTVSGDVRTVGMSGATVGLPDSFLSSNSNPAGLALLMPDADAHFVNNAVSDGHVQDRANPLHTGSLGLAAAFYPWAVSFGYVTTSREGMPYRLLNSAEIPTIGITTREYRLAVSRVLFSNRVSLGASLNLGQAEEQFEYELSSLPTASSIDHSVGATFGLLGQVSRHWLVGLSYTLPIRYEFARPAGAGTPIAGFYQPVVTPARAGLGAGWVPNRFFRTDISFFLVGRTGGAMLLRDDTTQVGEKVTLQPRAGAAYIFADFEEFRGTLFGGSYLEMSRIEGRPSRLHFTSGIEVKPWIFTLGFGLDFAPNYSNLLTGIGIDIIRVATKLKIIPKPYSPPRRGLLPDPTGLSDEGLARGLVEHWKPRGPDMNVIKVIREIPDRAEKQVDAAKNALKGTGFIIGDDKKGKAKKKTSKKKPGTVKKRMGPQKRPRSP